MAFAWNQIDRYPEAIEAYRKSMNLLLAIGDNENLPAVLINIGQVHQKLGRPDSAIFYNQQSVSLTNIPGREEEYSAALGNLGFIYKNMGNFEKAIGYYTRALEISKMMNKPVWISTDMNNIANVYSLWQKYDLAKSYLKQSITIRKELNDFAGMEVNLNNLAYAYQESGDLDSALILYNQSAAIAERLERYGNLAVRKINIGVLYYRKGDYDKAAKFVKEGLATNRELGLKLSVSGALQSLGVIYMAKNQPALAKEYLDEALSIAEQLNARIILEKIYESRSQLFEQTGNFRESLESYRKYVAIKDSIFTNKSQTKLAEMQARFETEKKQQQIELLLKNNQIHKAELKQKQTLLISLIIGISIFAISAIIIGLMFIQKTRAHRKLVEKNLELIKKDTGEISVNHDAENKAVLPETEKIKITKSLDQLMKTEKIFTQKQITLAEIATRIETNTSYLSRIINEDYHMNFSALLNSYRVREAQNMFAQNRHKSMSLEGIANMVGYQSRSTFNTAFKKNTGVTPSVYIKMLKELKEVDGE
jgi:tetratricopeptide (TPR) repeat protein